MLKFTLQRILVAGFVFTVTLILARLLEPEMFGAVAFFLYLAKSLSIAHLGAFNGYAIFTFAARDEGLPCSFPLFYQIQLILVGISVAFIGLSLGPVYTLAGMAFLLLSPFYVIEPVLRIKRAFYISLLPDIVLHAAVLGAALYFIWLAVDNISLRIMQYSLVGLAAGIGPLAFLVHRWRYTLLPATFPVRRGNFRKYGRLIAAGLPQYIGTLAFTVVLFVDRYFLEQYHPPAALGTYMLAVQLASGGALLVSSRNFVAAIDIGEVMRDGKDLRAMLRQQIRQTGGIALICYAALVLLSLVLEFKVLPAYQHLALATSSWGFGLMAFYVASSTTPIAVYLRRQPPLTVALWICVALVLGQNLAILWAGLDWTLLPIGSGLWLTAYAVFALSYVWRIAPRGVTVVQEA